MFDYNRAEATALLKSFQSHGLTFDESYMPTYQGINQKLWQSLERQEIKADVLRIRRFEQFLEAIEMTGSAEQLAVTYIEQLGLCTDLIDGAAGIIGCS